VVDVVTPFQIAVSDESIDDLRERIRRVDWARLPFSDGERYGASVPLLRRVLEHWGGAYSWRDWEAKLNSNPQFTSSVDGLDLHFWHVRGANPDSIPLLLIHGWPGSAVEYWDLLGPLTDPAAHGDPDAPSFDVVLVELPGFGFSAQPSEPGWGPNRIADAFDALMGELGYPQYAVHGGDWGTLLGARMARRHPEHVSALQISMPFTGPYGDFVPTPEWGGAMYEATGYLHLQGLIPDAVTVGATDSPLALAAWVIEKFEAWSDSGERLEDTFSLDVLATNLSFYWFPASIVSATRIYREATLEGGDIVGPPQIGVPTSVLVFPKEPYQSPRAWLEGVYRIERYSEFDSGGHFHSLEKPAETLAEIRAFFPKYFRGDQAVV
jgi:microsomal epoxide hydrolase